MSARAIINMQNKQRIAVSRLHLPDGQVLKNQVVETRLAEDGHTLRTIYYPLREELPFTEWHDMDYYL